MSAPKREVKKRELARASVNRKHGDILVGGESSSDLIDYLRTEGIQVSSSVEAATNVHLIQIPSEQDLDVVEDAIREWELSD